MRSKNLLNYWIVNGTESKFLSPTHGPGEKREFFRPQTQLLSPFVKEVDRADDYLRIDLEDLLKAGEATAAPVLNVRLG